MSVRPALSEFSHFFFVPSFRLIPMLFEFLLSFVHAPDIWDWEHNPMQWTAVLSDGVTPPNS